MVRCYVGEGGTDRECRQYVGGHEAQRVGRGPDHSQIYNVEVGDNNERQAQDTQEPSSSMILKCIVQFLSLMIVDNKCSFRLISKVILLCCSLRSGNKFHSVGSQKSKDFLKSSILGYGTKYS
jgi:hypothetical protein